MAINFKEFSESVVNRSNNKGKLNYIVLSEKLGKEYHKQKNFERFDSKSAEKKELRHNWQKYLMHCAANIGSFTAAEKKELYALIVEVQGKFSSAKQLYNAKNFEKENLAKALFSALKEFNK